MNNTSHLYIGLMSGTSMDGVDGVLADFGNNQITTLKAAFTSFPPALRSELMALQANSDNEIEREAIAANLLAACYAECVAALLPDAPGPVAAIAVHGQTIRHRPELGFTRQTNNPSLLAELTGIDVIADFRSRDIAAGGQGAPLVPAFHQAQFGVAGQNRVVVNIGGIGNISVLRADGRVTGYDTGPGNVLMDAWIARHLGKEYDADGAWAATGSVNPALLGIFLDEPYFSMPAPKSTGRDLFHADWLDAHLARSTVALPPEDVMATLTALTAFTIARAIQDESSAEVDAAAVATVYVCGGGAYNGTLLRELAAALGGRTRVESTAVLGVAPNRVEALAFAWLGYRFTQREPGNLPAVTGAKGARILGALYPA
ncbi:anhydro-N-acetylmuramic acid kinase [Massilia cavernae]|uniref:Anhydro-N-acetylmuramic acid kinase n=1 Tax=Massilia cavernae TaxID=2320864 RepID=A0A418XS70_9BURK|nr:anhydro-N-acetylmuramic acid kinase [Massilia cavernae]RJG15397.1 anhydro-N-acetylmuramic acid kinase [Massilia cavernae]